jgi:hypothetical protein
MTHMSENNPRKMNTGTLGDSAVVGRTTGSINTMRAEATDVPWVISRALNAEGDLHSELAQRYPNQPLMSLFSPRSVGGRIPRQLATLATQDGAAHLTFEIDPGTYTLSCAYTISSMLTLRFDLATLGDLDRTQWLEQVRQGQERTTILWGKMRWRSDYLVWSQKRHYANVYAFSPRQIEAAARLSPEVCSKLIEWLGRHWLPTQAQSDNSDSVEW